jgi:hypothetical protein
MDGGIQGVRIGKHLAGEIEGFEVRPDHLDIIEFGGVLEFDYEPAGPGGQCCRAALLT